MLRMYLFDWTHRKNRILKQGETIKRLPKCKTCRRESGMGHENSLYTGLTLGEEDRGKAWTGKPENAFFPGELEIVVGELYLQVILRELLLLYKGLGLGNHS